MSIDRRILELGLRLPAPHRPTGRYAPVVSWGDLVFVAGHGPVDDVGHATFKGIVGVDLSVEDGYEAARHCALNGLASLQSAMGSLDRVERVLRVQGFVRCSPDFIRLPDVLNGASDLLHDIFGGARASHARAAIGACSLPGGVAVEVEFTVGLSDLTVAGSEA